MTSHIETRDYDANRSVRSQGVRSLLDDDVSLMSEVAEGIIERDRRRMKREVTRVISLICALLACLCAGSIQSFSLYGPYFQSDLRYSQFRINIVSITGELAMYIPVPFLGYIVDRYSPRPLSLLGAILFGSGYILAAFTYASGPPTDTGYGHGWPFGIMALAFVGIGGGTSALYISGLATCAKNYGKSKHAGLVLVLPIAAIGLSGVWLSQVGEHLLSRKRSEQSESKDLDVFRYFIFLGCLLTAVGLIGVFGLRLVGEEERIEEAVEELERSGLLDESDFFRSSADNNTRFGGYGTLDQDRPVDQSDTADEQSDHDVSLSESMLLAKQSEAELKEQDWLKKTWLLNHETRKFLSDPTMWYLAAGFFLLIGPAEAYLNNVGTVITSLTDPSWATRDPPAGSASTHVSTIAIASTLARLLTGTLSDMLAPKSRSSDDVPQITTTAPSDSSHPETPLTGAPTEMITGISRLYLLFIASSLLLLCFLCLSVIVPSHPSILALSSGLLGLGYGTSFSLVPIIVSVVWGVENFGTNWGVIALMPAGGAVMWSAIYAVGYSRATPENTHQCYGTSCFAGWSWGSVGSVGVAMILFAGAWRGWRRRGVVV